VKSVIYYICITSIAIPLTLALFLLYIADGIAEDDYCIRFGNWIDKKLQPFKSWAFN